MALTIIKNPSHHNFSKSPVMCEIETDNYDDIGNFGNKAFGMFFTSSFVLGNYFKIVSTALTIQLDAINTTTPTAGKIRVKVGGDSLPTFWNKVLADILLNTSITALYNVTQDGSGGFLFNAINAGPQYSLNASIANTSSGNFFNYVDGTDDIHNGHKPNYRIRLEIKQEDTATFPLSLPAFKTIYTAQKEPYNNRVKFDLSKILNTNLSYYFPTPNLGSIVLCTQACKQFFVSIKEFYGTPAVEHITTITPTTGLQTGTQDTLPALLLKAGLSPKWTKFLDTFQILNYIWSYPLFLTTRSYFQNIKIGQPEYLFYLLYDDETVIKLKVVTYYDDGTINTAYPLTYSSHCYKGQLFCFPTNNSGGEIYNKMVAHNNVVKFEVNIEGHLSNIAISPVYTYIPDYNALGEDRIFLFTNSMGGVDTWRSEGNYENDINFEGDISNRIYFTDDAPYLGVNSQNQAYKQDVFKVFSGWKTQDDIDGFEELFLSDYKVEVFNTAIYMPIIITSKKYRRHKTNENLKGIEIEYYHQFKSPVTDKLAAAI